MSSRTPSSLTWLARKRARLSGQLEARQKELEKLLIRQQDLAREIDRFGTLVAAVDATIRLHHVHLEPSDIASVRPHQSPKFGYGSLTRALLSNFRANPGKWFSTGELVTVVCASNNLVEDNYDPGRMRRLVRKRLRALAARQIVARPSNWIRGEQEQKWRLHGDAGICGKADEANLSCQQTTKVQLSRPMVALPVTTPPIGFAHLQATQQELRHSSAL